ncbi:MAG: nucleotidyltransferase domain-containing protein [Chloroflexota bacterium]|nr:nucleotidyltransferase domain-containing protein [Chloroflexota bacterium]
METDHAGNDAPSIDPAVLEIARGVTRELVARGATAVVLLGSHARGDAHPLSDLDMPAITEASALGSVLRGGRLIVSGALQPEQVRASFRSPQDCPSYVPGWRRAVVLHDPTGIAAALRAEARAWGWDTVGDAACDRHVAEGVTGLAEEVHKLVAALDRGRPWTAAVQRSVLGLQLAGIMAVHHRIQYETENNLWDLVAARLGTSWHRAQGTAFGAGGEAFEDTCRAALELYILAARDVRLLLNAEQLAVVNHACAVAGNPIDAAPRHP